MDTYRILYPIAGNAHYFRETIKHLWKYDQNEGQRAMFNTFIRIENMESFPDYSEINLENNIQKINFKFPDNYTS